MVMAGVFGSHMPVSQTRAMSPASSPRWASTQGGRCLEPHSSSPSMRNVMSSGSVPVTAFQARQASMNVITWPLSSQAPRATIASRPSGSIAIRGSKGGVCHRSSGSTGCTS